MKQLASNAETYELLESTSKNSRVKNTSGYQGEVKKLASYTTQINKKNVDVQIARTGKYDWNIKRIEVQ